MRRALLGEHTPTTLCVNPNGRGCIDMRWSKCPVLFFFDMSIYGAGFIGIRFAMHMGTGVNQSDVTEHVWMGTPKAELRTLIIARCMPPRCTLSAVQTSETAKRVLFGPYIGMCDADEHFAAGLASEYEYDMSTTDPAVSENLLVSSAQRALNRAHVALTPPLAYPNTPLSITTL